MDIVNVMITNSKIPENLWGKALLIAYYIINKIPLKHSDKTPLELWKKVPKLEHLRVWECLAKVEGDHH